MKLKPLVASLALTATLAPVTHAGFGHHGHHGWGHSEAFHHVATFDVTRNTGSEVAEIVDVSVDGKTLVYTDSASELIGFVDITNPGMPAADGTVAVGGEPTSVAVRGRYALAGVNRQYLHDNCNYLHRSRRRRCIRHERR